MEDGHFELQLFGGAAGADGSKSFGELLRRGVGGESFHWVGSGRAESLVYRVEIVRVPSQNSNGKISLRWM